MANIIVPRRIPWTRKPGFSQSAIDNNHPLVAGLIGAFAFSEGAGQILYDIFKGQNGTLQGGTARNITKGIRSLLFDGSDDFVDLSTYQNSLKPVVGRTYIWLLHPTSTSESTFLGGSDGAFGNIVRIQFSKIDVYNAGTWTFDLNGSIQTSVSSSSSLEPVFNDWNILFGWQTTTTTWTDLFLGKAKTSRFYGGSMGLLLVLDRIVPVAERRELARNIWQVFKPRRRYIPLSTGAGGTTVNVGLASELSAAFAISRLKQTQIGLSAETDTALAATAAKVSSVGLSTETDTAFSILRAKIKAAGLGAETDSALALIISSAVNVGLSSETDQSLAVSRLKKKEIGLSTEADTALSVGRSKIKIAGLGIETDVAFTMSWSKIKALGLSSELDQALAVSSTGSLAVGIASELDVALVIGRLKQQIAGLSTESDQSLPTSRLKSKQIGLPIEADAALSVTSSSAQSIGLATESDLAQSVARIKQKLIGLAPETDVALAVTIGGVVIVINTSAAETLKLLAENPTLTVSADNATLTLS